MKRLWLIAAAEWRHGWRSRLAQAAALLMAALLMATTVGTASRVQADRDERAHHQAQADEAFRTQPDRHPHRMVHYGHYVFRTPTPLALFDPGLDPVTGQTLFLEGHRQNTAAFAASGASADLGGLSRLTPARVLQWFGPLLIVLLAHAALVREREAGTLPALLAQGLSGSVLLAGKALALLGVVLLMLLPLAGAALWAVVQGEALAVSLALWGVYALYLLAWAAAALAVSALLRRRAAVLAVLCSAWIGLTLVAPVVAVEAAAAAAPVPGKIEADLAMLAEVRKLGDGHNANDPAFARLRADLLAKHGVQRVEDLPVNLRGVVAEAGEQRLTETLNAHARARMAAEAAQAQALSAHGWWVPVLAVAHASRALAGSDLAHHHRFQEEAEALRYQFVQGLNRVHTERLAYADDIRRSSDPEAERRTRVDAAHWQLLQQFRFTADTAELRFGRAAASVAMLALWATALLGWLAWVARRVAP
jgi:ABC-2 type transport system permease protein